MNTLDFQSLSNQDFDSEQYLQDLLNKSNLPKNVGNSLEEVEEYLDQMYTVFQDLDKELIKEKKKIEAKIEDEIIVNEINDERQQKKRENMQAQLNNLKTDYQKIDKQLQNLNQNFTVQSQISSLDKDNFTYNLNKTLLNDFQQLNTVNQNEIPLLYVNYQKVDFYKAAQYINILENISNQIEQDQWKLSIKNINYKYKEISKYLILQFKGSFLRLDIDNLQNLLYLIDNYQLVDQISLYYIEHFLGDLKVIQQYKNQQLDFIKEDLQSLFFLLLKAFKKSLSCTLQGCQNYFQIQKIFGEGYSPIVLRQFMKYTFENIIERLLENILDSHYKKGNHKQWLLSLEFLWDKCQQLGEDLNTQLEFDLENNSFQSQIKELYNSFMKSAFEHKQIMYFDIERDYLEIILRENIYLLLNQVKQESKEKNDLMTSKMKSTKKMKQEIQKWVIQIKNEDGEKIKLDKQQMASRLDVLLRILVQEQIEIIFVSTAQALERNYKLSKASQREHNKFILLETFLKGFGQDLILSLIEFASYTVPALNRKTQLNPVFFQVIPRFNILIQRMDILFSSFINGVRSDVEQQQLENKREALTQTIEMNIQSQIQNALASIFVHSNLVLKEYQDKKDFYLKKFDDIHEGIKETSGIQQFINHIRQYTKQIEQFSTPANKARFLESIGEQVIKLLIDHYPQYKVTLPGSFQAMADLSYVEKFLFNELRAKPLQLKFNNLKKLLNIFKMDLDNLDKYIRDTKFINISEEIIQNYVDARKEIKNL